MSEINLLDTKIQKANIVLKESLGIQDDLEGQEIYKFLEEKTLAEAYKTEATRKNVASEFLAISKSIRDMRSSFLPIDYFLNYNNFNIDISSQIAEQESYENAFMRMLGMPSIGNSLYGLSEEDIEIRASEKLLIVNPKDGSTSEVSFEEVRLKILDERQKAKSSRKVIIDNSIYNIDLCDLLTKINEISGKDEIMTASIETIESDIWKFAYLLIPPIQDINISKYINEPGKIISPAFSEDRNKKINTESSRPSLLETVIRIRLDRVSGTTSFSTADESDASDAAIIEVRLDGNKNNSSSENIPVESDSFGILESLFILRLRSSISGLAKKLYSDIDIMINEMEKCRRIPGNTILNSSACIDDGSTVLDINSQQNVDSVNVSNGAASNMEKIESDGLGINDIKLTSFEQQKLLEDSLLFLLGNRSEVLELQSQTQRSSTMYNSPMMSGLINIIDLPRKRISDDSKKIITARNDSGSQVVDQKVQEIGVTLGTDIGIGTIDISVYALAMFTVPEDILLGLLSKAQFERIKNGEFKSLITNPSKIDSVTALNEFTRYIIDGYKLFIRDLSED